VNPDKRSSFIDQLFLFINLKFFKKMWV